MTLKLALYQSNSKLKLLLGDFNQIEKGRIGVMECWNKKLLFGF